jgi:TnpA family transposase
VEQGNPPESVRPLLHGGLDFSLLDEQWDQLVRVAASLHNRVANASPADRVAKALTTLGRIVKTIYILRYIHEEELRQRVQLQLNRGESRHALARWLFFANRGEFRTGDYEEIMNKASCLSLLSNAVLVWNTLAITKIATQLRAAGEAIADQDLTRISPLMHQHVIPNGTYHFARSEQGNDIA